MILAQNPVLATRNSAEARTEGFVPLAGPFYKEQRWMLANVTADMVRGAIPFVIVPEDGGHTLYRQQRGMRHGSKQEVIQ